MFLDAILTFKKLIFFKNFTIFLANCIIWENAECQILDISKDYLLKENIKWPYGKKHLGTDYIYVYGIITFKHI